MRRFIIGLVILMSTAAWGRDLAIVSIKSAVQSERATAILGGAYTAVGDGYLVALDSVQRGLLNAAGISFQIVKTDGEPKDYAMQFSVDPVTGKPFTNVASSDAIPIDQTVSLVPRNRAPGEAAERLQPLGEPLVPFTYWPPVQTVLPRLDGYPTDSLARMVNHDSVLSYVMRLQDFYTRYYKSDSTLRAIDWLVSKFQDWGYTDVTTPPFVYEGTTYHNIKVVKPGYAEPDKVILLGGHLDAWCNSCLDHATGADDDASGVAVLLEVARVIKDVPLRKTVVFMPFNAEEPWMKGSFPAAQDLYDAGTRIEVMLNYDMIAFTHDDYPNIGVAGGPNHAYADLESACGNRVTSLIAIPDDNYQFNGDHWPFFLLGYPVVRVYESDIAANWTYHTANDNMANMNSHYMAEAVRMAAATVGYVANAGNPITISTVIDRGDGQSVEVRWPAGDPAADIHLRYGTVPGTYTDSLVLPGTNSGVVVDNLTLGTTYYFTIVQVPRDGYPSVYTIESSQTPLITPRPPSGVVAAAETSGVSLWWHPNKEADLASYSIYRRPIDVGDYQLIASGVTDTTFVDGRTVGQVGYQYKVAAVDFAGHHSTPSAPVSSYRATFDGGPLVVDEFTAENEYLPTQAHQLAWFDSLFDPSPHLLISIDSSQYYFSRSIAGRSSSVFWIDDDNYNKLAPANRVDIQWYLAHRADMLLSGYRTLWNLCPTLTIPDTSLLFREFGIVGQATARWPDFIGARGEDGWPDVELSPARGLYELSNVTVLTPSEGASVIYRYHSSGDSTSENLPCALLFDTPNGKRIALGFPLWYLTPSSARALIQRALVEFGETGVKAVGGDVDRSGIVDIGDVSLLVDYLFVSLQPLPAPEQGDVDGSCNVDIRDLTLLIQYLFFDGASPQPGCPD